MISNTPDTIIVDGVSYASTVYKRNENETVNGNFYVADGNGGSLGAIAIAMTDEIKAYFLKPILLHGTSVYNISGVATPGDTMIFISSGSGGNIERLRSHVIATAYADKQGNFNFSNIAWSTGNITMWMVTLAQDAPTASLTYELSITDYDHNIGKLLTHSFNEPEGDCEVPFFSVSGTCSEDIEKVYISCADNAISVTYLMETMCGYTVPSNGKFTVQCTGDYDQNYIVWAIAKIDGELTVASINIYEDSSTCLSGDTMITMADVTVKRMDNICVGDIVLSENGVPSRVHTVKNGYFSKYHTLYYFEDGTVIDETHPHRFYNVDQGFWQRLQLWNIGDHAINQDGHEVALVSVEHLDEEAEMFGIWTDNGTYFANGLLSGAAFCNKELLAEATAEQAIDMMLSTDEKWLLQLMGLEGGLPL